MFIPKSINKIDFKENILKINETTAIKFNKCDLDTELIESLISKGAYASTLLYLNSKCLVESINDEILTKESYSSYLQECKDLLKENVYETTASGFRQLCNINGLELLENSRFVARGKTKLFVENFKEEYFPDLILSIISKFSVSDMSREEYMKALTRISELEWENKISEDEYDRANKKINRLYIENRRKNKESITESYVKIDKCLDIISSIRNACEEAGNDKEAVRTFLQTLNNEIKSLANSYDVLIEEINECEGTQTTDIAPKLDQEMNGLVEPPKQDDLKEEYDFNVGFNHNFKGFILTEQGRYERGNFVLIKENGVVRAISKSKLKENVDKNTIEVHREQITRGNDVYDIVINDTHYYTYYNSSPKRHNDHKTYIIDKNGKNILFTSSNQTFRKYLRDIESGLLDGINLGESTRTTRAKIIDDYGNSVWDYDEVVNVQAPRLINELNKKFGEEYDFGFRIEDDMLVVFDKNENFDFSYMDEANDKADKIVKSLFGHNCYLEAELPVIAVVAGMFVRDLN